jgi:glycerophosphodiester phosphodiesterase
MKQTPSRVSRAGSPDRVWEKRNGNSIEDTNGKKSNFSYLRRHRSMSLHEDDGFSQADWEERMKHTRAFKKHGFKGNSRGTSIQAPFATLEETFKSTPSTLGFNIELKYPMLQESEDEEMGNSAIEMNSWVDCGKSS